MDEQERADFAERLHLETSARFAGTKQSAYTAARVNSGTWERALEGLTIKPHTLHKIVSNLWPETRGDWRRIPPVGGGTQDERSYVESPGDRAEGSVSDSEVLRAIQQMQEDIRTMSQRLAELEQGGGPEPVDGAGGAP